MTYVKTKIALERLAAGERSRSASGRAARERAAERRRGRPLRGRGGAARGEPGAFRVLVEKGAEARRSGRSSGWWRRPDVNEDRIERYARQPLVPGFGAEAQDRLGACARAVGADAVASAGLVPRAGRRRPALDRGRRGRLTRRRERLAVRAVVGRYAARRRGARRSSPRLACCRWSGIRREAFRPPRSPSRRPCPGRHSRRRSPRGARESRTSSPRRRRRRRARRRASGAPCYACARSTTGSGAPRSPASQRSPRWRRRSSCS